VAVMIDFLPTILFVDDEKSTLNSMCRFLRREPCRMLFAESGKDALAILAEGKVDILVTDLRMPEMTGLELLEIVSNRFSRILRLVVSATMEKRERDQVLEKVDVYEFISKPLNPEEFREILRMAISIVPAGE
jgi:CheY-like chemotaxis protein